MNEAIQIVVGGVLLGSIFAILALGFSLVYRVTGVINLSQGAFCILAAMIMYSLQTSLGWPVLVAAAGGVGITTCFGLVIGALTFVPAMSRLSNSNILMLTVGLLTAINGLILVIWGNQPYALPPFSGEKPFSLLGIRFPTQSVWIVGATLCIIVGLWFLLNRTTMGKALRACAENPGAARLMGINVPRMMLFSFGLAAFVGAIGGVVVSPIISIEFSTGQEFTISGFIAVTIGGLQSFAGAIFGGLALGVIMQLAAGYVSSMFSNGLALALLLIMLLVRPTGLFAPDVHRREDVREAARVHIGLVRLTSRQSWLLGGAMLAIAVSLPWFSSHGVLNSLTITGILFLSVIGLDVLMGWTGQINLGQAGFMAIGGYAAAVLSTRFGFSPLEGTLVGMAISLICSLALSMVVMKLRGLYLALATLAFGLLIDSMTVGLTDLTGGPSGLVGIPSFAVGGIAFKSAADVYYLVLGMIVLILLALAGCMRSSFGRSLQAIRTDQLAAAALGINVTFHKMAAFAISALLGSLSGSMYAFYFHYLSPEMVGTSRSLEMVAMLVIGGEGTLIGPLLGVALLTLLPTVFQPLAVFKTLAEGILLITSFLYMPQGIFGTLVFKCRALRCRKDGDGLLQLTAAKAAVKEEA
jgi:branched-chain amino acid transport system permease protein